VPEPDGQQPRPRARTADTRALNLRETWFWYVFAGVTYIGASLAQKGLLNWFVGPAWLVAVVWFGPLLVDRIRGRTP
jgi:hypothetical protein